MLDTKPFVSVVTCTCGAGVVDGMPNSKVHDSRWFTSCVEVFHCESGDWLHQPTSGAPPLGVNGYSCTAVGDTLHFFGGYCNHGINCYHNSIHSLDTSSLHWVELSPTTSEGGAPMRKHSMKLLVLWQIHVLTEYTVHTCKCWNSLPV